MGNERRRQGRPTAPAGPEQRGGRRGPSFLSREEAVGRGRKSGGAVAVGDAGATFAQFRKARRSRSDGRMERPRLNPPAWPSDWRRRSALGPLSELLAEATTKATAACVDARRKHREALRRRCPLRPLPPTTGVRREMIAQPPQSV